MHLSAFAHNFVQIRQGMAWLGTPHDGEIVRQRENIGQLMQMIVVPGRPFFGLLALLVQLDESMMPAPVRTTPRSRRSIACEWWRLEAKFIFLWKVPGIEANVEHFVKLQDYLNDF